MPDVAVAVHCRCNLTIALLSGVHGLAELDFWHCQSKGGFGQQHLQKMHRFQCEFSKKENEASRLPQAVSDRAEVISVKPWKHLETKVTN